MKRWILQSKLLLALLLMSLGNHAYSKTVKPHNKTNPIIQRSVGNIDEAKAANLGQTAVNVATGQALPSTASFFAQLTIATNILAGGTYENNPAVDVAGRIHVASADMGQIGEILMVAQYNNTWFMKTQLGWMPWDLQLNHLAANTVPRALAATEDLNIVSQLTLLGDFNIYIGYRLQGIVHYSPNPLAFTLVAEHSVTCGRPLVYLNGMCVPGITPTTPATPKLNDTGITQCSNEIINSLACPQATHLGQDAESGGDVTHNDPSDGHAGFSFTKISSTGAALTANATNWNCLKDNVTGLMWEIKTDDNGLHDKDWSYTWYEPDNTKNGGNAGVQNGGICGSASSCDIHTYVQAVNAASWCGYNDWRMPTIDELGGIVVLDREMPAIDTAYFPHTVPIGSYWSSSPAASNNLARFVYFRDGYSGAWLKSEKYQVRLVRNGQ